MRKFSLLALMFLTACGNTATPQQQSTSAITSAPPEPSVQKVFAHNTQNFTEGLQIYGNTLLESTGLVGKSELIAYDLSGQKIRSIKLPEDIFGEGLTTDGKTIWVLTYRSQRILMYDFSTFDYKGEYQVTDTQELWGACLLDGKLLTSNGSDTLTYRDTNNGQPLSIMKVPGRTKINELECTGDGKIYANIFQTPLIIQIDKNTGQSKVIYRGIDQLKEQAGADVMNGIAAQEDGSLLFTGKFWNSFYSLKPEGN